MDFFHSWIVPPGASETPAYMLMACAALFFVSVDKGGLGGGIGIVSMPLLLQVAPFKFVVGMWLPVLVVCDFCTIRNYPSQWRYRAVNKLAFVFILAIIGTSLMLWRIKLDDGSDQTKRLEAWLKLSIAMVSVIFLLLKLRPTPDEAAPPWEPTWAASWAAGILGGITTTIAHAAGPIVTMYLLPQKMDRREYIGTTGRFYFTLNSLKIPSFIAAGLITLPTVRYGLWLMLLAPLGVGLGSWLNQRIKPLWFVRIVHASLVLVAGKFAWDAWKVMG
jgi:uncharacterized membrane protein YfcA